MIARSAPTSKKRRVSKPSPYQRWGRRRLFEIPTREDSSVNTREAVVRDTKTDSGGSVEVQQLPPLEKLSLSQVSREKLKVDADSLCDHIRSINVGQVLSIEQQVKFEYNKNPYVFKVMQGVIEGQKDLDGMQLGMISAETCMIFKTSYPRRVKILNQHEPSSIFRQKEFDFQSLGVGTDESFKEMFLGMIASRMYHPRVARKYGVKHVKGFLIHGPSGTGKTLLARTLGVILKNTKAIDVKSGILKRISRRLFISGRAHVRNCRRIPKSRTRGIGSSRVN
nr:vesicle-fusing ATPase-like isoform X3 [Coffea arabica]